MKTTLKRIAAPKTWPIHRKGTTFVTRPRPKGQSMAFTLPMSVVLRDVLTMVDTNKQGKLLMREHEVKVNGKRVYQPDDVLGFMDLLSIGKNNYVLTITEKGALTVEPTKDNHSIQKLTGKTNVRGGKTQLNFLSGMNILVDKDTYKTGDSFLVQDGKITKHIKFDRGAEVLVIGGNHMGQTGKIEEIDGTTLTIKGKDSFQTTKDNVYVMKA